MLAGKRIAILIEDGFEDSELLVPYKVMKDAGARVKLVGDSRQNFRGRRGQVIRADVAAENIKVKEYDAVIIPGGLAPDKIRLTPSMVNLIKNAHGLDKLIAAIGYGPQLLISADIVRGVRLTSWPSIAVDLKNAGAVWEDVPVLKDGNIITSRRTADLPRFNRVIVETLIKS